MTAPSPDPTAGPDTFQRLLAGVEPDAAVFRAALASAEPATRRYVLLFSPRSGSTWLAFLLEQTGVLGRPFEYIHPDHVAGHARAAGTTDPAGLLAVLLRQRKTPNGVFGIKTLAADIVRFGEAPFFAEFGGNTEFFCL
jgi:hypothetical protein